MLLSEKLIFIILNNKFHKIKFKEGFFKLDFFNNILINLLLYLSLPCLFVKEQLSSLNGITNYSCIW